MAEMFLLALRYTDSELELELIKTHMTQRPMLRVEEGARALRNQTGGGGNRFL